jgi:hypothetical protein
MDGRDDMKPLLVALMLFGPLLAAPVARGMEPARLAPDPASYATHRARLEEHLLRAEATSEALIRVHNRLAERQARGGAGPCADPEGQGLVARARAFGRALRDAVQAARVQTDRVRRMAEARTLAPLLSAEDHKRLDALVARNVVLVHAYAELSAWHAAHVPSGSRCSAELVPAPGLTAASPQREAAAVAVVAVGGGRICPEGLPADGRVVVLPQPRACYSDAACSCTPAEVLPGAVLGP